MVPSTWLATANSHLLNKAENDQSIHRESTLPSTESASQYRLEKTSQSFSQGWCLLGCLLLDPADS